MSQNAVDANPKPEYARVHLGTAPDSWGIWFPDDPKQPHWSMFLDEVVQAIAHAYLAQLRPTLAGTIDQPMV